MKMYIKEKTYVLLAFLSVLCMAGYAAPQSAIIGGITYSGDDAQLSNGASVTKIDQSVSGAVVIPKTVELGGKTFEVKSLNGFIFRGSNITSLTLPVSIRNIPASSLGVSDKLEEIKFDGDNPNFTVEDGILYNKNKTTLIYYPAAKNVDGYTLPSTVTTLGGSAFSRNKSMTSFKIPVTITNIENGGGDAGIGVYGPFYACENLKTVTFAAGSTIKRISNFCFSKCYSLETVNFPETITEVAYYGMNDCTKFRGPLPKYLEKIGRCGFQDCDALTEIVFPVTMKELGSEAFNVCDNITKVVIPDECPLREISFHCFAYNYKLKDLQISDNITIIHSGAFTSCNSLTEVKMPEHLKEIRESAFEYCRGLKKVDFKNELELIGHDAFAWSSVLEDYTFPVSLKTIGVGAFMRTNATAVNIPANVTSIGGAAFARNQKLTAFTVDEANTAYKVIEGILFTKDAKTLMAYPAASTRNVSYTIPARVETIHEGAFSDATLTHITLPSSLKTIYNGAFAYNGNLTELTIPASVTEIARVSQKNYGMYSENIILGTNIRSIYLLNPTTPPVIVNPNYQYPKPDYSGVEKMKIYVKKAAYESGIYQAADGWNKYQNYAYKIPAKMNENGVSTLGRDFDVDLSEAEVTAYLAESASTAGNNVYVTMREVSVGGKTPGKYIPSRTGEYEHNGIAYETYTGALLKGTAGSTFTYTIGESDDAKVETSAKNYLLAVTDATVIAPSKNVGGEEYTNLLLKDGKFRYAISTGTVPYNRSYLSMPTSIIGSYNAAAPAKQFIFQFENTSATTGIDGVPATENKATQGTETDNNRPWYNIKGEQVNHPQRGIYIQRGKKIIIK